MFKKLGSFFRKRFERFYRQSRWQLILDVSLIVVILILALAVLSLHFYNPKISDFGTGTNRINNTRDTLAITEPPVEVSFSWEKLVLESDENAQVLVKVKNKAAVNVSGYKLIFISRDNNFSALGELVLSDLAANSEQDFPVEIKLTQLAPTSEKNVSLRAEQSYQVNNQNFKDSYDLPIIKIISELVVSAAAYYNSPQGDQLGSGPLPPVVGLPTNFWIFLKAEADGNFDNFSLSAKLPKNVELTENSSLLAGDLNYNEAARQIVWRVEKLEANSSEYRAGFEVQLIPEANQVGSPATLLQQLRYQGEDSFTDTKIEGTATGVDTSLEADALNRGEGKIMPLEDR